MDPETSEPDNRYAPPAGEALPERTEPWTLGGSIAAAIRTSLKAPFLAWVALGAIPSLTAVPGMLELDDAESGLLLLVVMFVVSAVLAGGQYTIALALVRKQPVRGSARTLASSWDSS